MADNEAGFKMLMTQPSRRCMFRYMRTAAVVALIAAVGSCTGSPSSDDSIARRGLLRNNLSVAAAALTAGQPSVARRLYQSLAERFEDAPEPSLGLAYIAISADDYTAAKGYFLRAAALADDAPSVKAEAFLGAGRAALAEGEPHAARQHFEDARKPGRKQPSAAWIVNGIAVLATLDADYGAAEADYGEALRLSSGHPRIAANLVRMLLAAGKVGDAVRIHAQHDPSYWLDDDGRALSRLIEAARRERRREAATRPSSPGLTMRLQASGGAARPVEWVEPPNSSGLVLRLVDRPPRAPPAAAIGAPQGFAAEPAAEPSPPATEPVKVEDGTPGRSPPTALTLTLGQSWRLGLGSGATSVLVASPEVADVQLLSPKLLYIIGKNVGRTSVAVLGEGGRVRDWIVSVVLDLEPILAILAKEPDLREVRAKRIARGVALSGNVASAALAERALRLAAAALPKDMIVENELQVAGAHQVSLEVQIAEVQRSVTENLGINWNAFRTTGDNLFGFRIGRLATAALPGGTGIGAFPPVSVDGQVSPSLFFGRQTGNSRITGMIDALARSGSANVLARPNLTAVSGEAASFFSGGEYPLPTGFKDGVILFEYKKYGVLLDFVPTVIDTGRIVLNVRPEVSEPSQNQSVQVVGVSIPVINVRRAETTVEVGDGESIVIGGLFRNASNTREVGIPLLKDVPLLGPLFGQRSIHSEDLELIVFVTARLVSAGAAPDEEQAPSSPRVEGYHY